MASSTSLSFTMQARDWETLIGIIANSADPDIQEMEFQLSTYYRVQTTKPLGTSTVSVTTTEGALMTVVDYLYGNTIMNITKDVGTNPFNRIMTAIRAANNVADNYISTTLATKDANFDLTATNIRKNGRRILLIKQYDNN